MEIIEKFVREYDCLQFDQLPNFVQRRVDALKKLQLEHVQLQHAFHKEVQELELKYEKLQQPLYEKRYKIVTGDYEPTDEECHLPDNLAENEHNEQENENGKAAPLLSKEQENSLKSKVKGIPGFWLGCLVSTFNFNDSIEDHDRQVLRYMKDLRMSYSSEGDFLTYKLEFLFDDNPHFTNKVLTKTYYLKLKPDEKDPFSYDGFEVFKSEGCEINWNPGKNITVETVPVKQRNKMDGRIRQKKKEVERDSFFYFFKPPKMPEGGEEFLDDEAGAIMAVDFELGEVIRQSIIPKAVLYYTGYMMEEEDDGEDGEDEDDDDDDDDESDMESTEDEDEEGVSDDSLSASKKND